VLSRTPWAPPPLPPRTKQYKFRGEQRRALIFKVAKQLRHGEPTAFARSAFLTHTLRTNLCLQGVGWTLAQFLAHDVVLQALRQIGARWPSWAEGQREYTAYGYNLRIDVCCWQCGDALPMDKKKFCCDACRHVWHRNFTNH
jgi:hypothetical protein